MGRLRGKPWGALLPFRRLPYVATAQQRAETTRTTIEGARPHRHDRGCVRRGIAEVSLRMPTGNAPRECPPGMPPGNAPGAPARAGEQRRSDTADDVQARPAGWRRDCERSDGDWRVVRRGIRAALPGP